MLLDWVLFRIFGDGDRGLRGGDAKDDDEDTDEEDEDDDEDDTDDELTERFRR